MKTILLCLGFAAVMAGAQGQPAEQAYIRAGADGRSWAIGNSLVERSVAFAPDQGLLRTTAWRYKLTGADFIRPVDRLRRGRAEPEFSFQADQAPVGGFDCQGASVSDVAPGGKQLAIRLSSRSLPVDVTVFYAVYAGHPAVRKWISIHNRGTAALTLTHLVFDAANLAPGPESDVQVSGFYGLDPRENFYTGRVDDPAILVRSSSSGQGYAVLNEAPGYLKRTEVNPQWHPSLEVMYDTDLFPFERRLAPGETFLSAASSILFFADGRGFADPRWVVPSYASEILMRRGSAFQPPWIYNTWEPFERGITEGIVRDSIAAAGRMGMDIFTIDDGWQLNYGENEINPKLFPRGLDEIEAAVEKAGMRLGLWVPLAAVSPQSRVYREHPEWVCRDRDGRPKFTGTMAGAQAVMCLDTPYRKVAARRINDLIARYHLKYVKVDLTTVFNAYGESPGCYATGHDHQTWAESLDGIYEGIAYVTAAIAREHPDVLVDLTFELWGQKHVIDYGLMEAGDFDWLSNVQDAAPGDAGPRAARTLLYLRSLAIPAETMLIGNLHADLHPIEDRLATAMGAGPLFLGDLRQLSPSELDWYRQRILSYKALRARVRLNEGFFPLGAWRQPRADAWDGYARLARSGEGLIALFHNESGAPEADLALPAFPDGDFTLKSMMTERAIARYSGAQIRAGVRIPFPPGAKVEVIELDREDGSRAR